MKFQAGFSPDHQCTTAQTVQGEKCFRESLRSNLWACHSISSVSHGGKGDVSPTTSFPQYEENQALQHEKPKLHYYQNTSSPNQTGTTESSAYCEEIGTSSFVVNATGNQTNFPNFSAENSPRASSSISFLQEFTDIPRKKERDSLNFSENSFGPKDCSSQSSVEGTQDESTVKLDNFCVGPAGMELPRPKYHILEPIKISRMAQSLQKLETKFVQSYFRIKRHLEQRRQTSDGTRDFLRAYSLTEQGQTHFVVTFGSVEHEVLPRVHELKQAFRELEFNLMECKLNITNENDCSEIWTGLDTLKDHTIFLRDALLDFSLRLRRMHWWMINSHIPACIYFYSQVGNMHYNPASKLNDKDIEADIVSPTTVLQDAFNNNVTIQLSITFYQDCIQCLKISIDSFLRAIREGTFTLDELVVWVRLCSLSIEDISHGLSSFSKLSKNVGSETC